MGPQSPWILYFDGATRATTGVPAGIGAVLKNSRGHTVVELKKLVAPGVSSGVAKYKALIAGLKKALSLGVVSLLVKGDSRLVHNQVVGHCSIQDDQLIEYQRKVMALSKDFRALFMERISREYNVRADRLANDAIDEELQVVDSLSEHIDQEWTTHEKHASQQHSVHTHRNTHLRPHAYPLPLPAQHPKVKPVASVSPHVVKRHLVSATANRKAATGSDNAGQCVRGRRSCSDEESSVKVAPRISGRKSSQHVQAAAQSRNKPGRDRLLTTSPTKRAPIAARVMTPVVSLESQTDIMLPFSDESGETSQENNLQKGEGNSSGSGSGTADQDSDLPHTDEKFEAVSSVTEESVRDDVQLSEAEDYESMVETLLKGFFKRKTAIRT